MTSIALAVIGAQKSGSTHLAICLGEHPEIHMAPHEVPFFEDPYFSSSDPAALESVLASSKPVVGIKRPDYLAAAEVPARLLSHSPDSLVLAVLRDPIDRVVSAYYWYVQFGYLPLLPLNEGLTRILSDDLTGYPRASEIIDGSRYGTHLRHWASHFPLDQIVVFATDAVGTPSTYRSLFERLGVDQDFAPPTLAERSNDGVFDHRRLKVLRARRPLLFDWPDTAVYSARSPRAQSGWKAPVAAAIGLFDKVVLNRLLTAEKEPVSSQLRSRLVELLEPELTIVREDFGLELSP